MDSRKFKLISLALVHSKTSTVTIVHQLLAYLCTLSLGTSSAEHLGDLRKTTKNNQTFILDIKSLTNVGTYSF